MLKPPQEVLINILERVQGTCEWIFHCENFIQWNNSPSRDPLWIHGHPGMYKYQVRITQS